MPHLVWSNPALADLRRLRAFLRTKDPDAAERGIAAIRQSVLILKGQPQIGQRIHGLQVQYRQWPVRFGSSGYVTHYRYEDDNITILRVWHMREDF